MLRALHRAFTDLGGTYFADHRVTDITRLGDGAAVTAGNEVFHAPRTVIAAGNACAWLAPLVGLDVPVKPEKGQIIVTERTRPLFRYPTHLIRQSGEGTLMFGDSHEDVGFDDRSRMGPLHAIAAYAVRTYPMLKDLKVVRSWGCLRIMPHGRVRRLRPLRRRARRLHRRLPQRRDPGRGARPQTGPVDRRRRP